MNVANQIPRNQEATLTLTVYDDGTAADEGAATFITKDLDGTTIDTLAVTDNGDGTYEVTIPAKSDLAFLTAYLSFDTGTIFDQGRIEIVGNLLMREDQVRAFRENMFADGTDYDDADLAEEQVRVMDWLENQTGRSWVPRYRRLTLAGNYSQRLNMRHYRKSQGASGGEGAVRNINTVLAATIDGSAVDTSTLEIDSPHIWRNNGLWTSPTRGANTTIDIEYGLEHLANGADRIALLELADRLKMDRRDDAVVSGSDEFGTFNFEPQNSGRPSRVPEVNAWCRDNDKRLALA